MESLDIISSCHFIYSTNANTGIICNLMKWSVADGYCPLRSLTGPFHLCNFLIIPSISFPLPGNWNRNGWENWNRNEWEIWFWILDFGFSYFNYSILFGIISYLVWRYDVFGMISFFNYDFNNDFLFQLFYLDVEIV